MKKHDETTMSRAEFERRKQRWFLIAGRPIKIASNLLDKAKEVAINFHPASPDYPGIGCISE